MTYVLKNIGATMLCFLVAVIFLGCASEEKLDVSCNEYFSNSMSKKTDPTRPTDLGGTCFYVSAETLSLESPFPKLRTLVPSARAGIRTFLTS